MGIPVQSPWDALSSGRSDEIEVLRLSLRELAADLRSIMDGGVTTGEYPVFQGLRSAAEAALEIVEGL
jgi:hypothetical protein